MTDDDRKQWAVVEAIEKVTSNSVASVTSTSPETPIHADKDIKTTSDRHLTIPTGDTRGTFSLGRIYVDREVATISDKRVAIGMDAERDVAITLADRERERGFYILGQPRTGQSTLLVSMALADIQNGHGVLFIDHHTDATKFSRGFRRRGAKISSLLIQLKSPVHLE